MLPLLKLYKSTIEKHNNTIEVNTLLETQQAACILLTLRETLKLKPILVIKPITIYTLLQTPKNDTLLKITDFTIIAELITQIVQISTAKTSKIVLIKVNANEPFRVFVHLNYKIQHIAAKGTSFKNIVKGKRVYKLAAFHFECIY